MKHKKKQNAPAWVTMPINGETLDVLRVWQLNDAGHKWPQAAILRALTTGAKQLAEDHTVLLQFLNDNDVFSKDVKVVSPQVSVPPGPAPCNPPHWDFIVVHGRASTARVIQVPCFEN
ncbi:MAG TPA: hypothetical protein VN948_11845 [Terriglobales bacterium]|nr:hypothetical protein [Terriglobales bacterium]